ncbi:hypothetical protein PsYK624_063520 [Phanerochaete sordida]|uniref:Uncharacterized protein n=1 Tax=Phanerochaete sordida TaxID=48140 RepID=A0A9P3GA64_9APHY|nr:hypothetical protein PsYK624_063520 [Phanerochaete sordida]
MDDASEEDSAAARTAPQHAASVTLAQTEGEEDSEEDSEEDLGDSEPAESDEANDAILLEALGHDVRGRTTRTTAVRLQSAFDDAGLRSRGPPASSQDRARAESARRRLHAGYTPPSSVPRPTRGPPVVRGPFTPPDSEDDVRPSGEPSYSRRDEERPRPLRVSRRKSPRRWRERAAIHIVPAPPQDDVRPYDAGDEAPDVRAPGEDSEEPVVSWYGALVTLTTLGLGTWKLAAAYANEAAVAMTAVDWVLSVVLALLFFWLDRLCRSVRWLRWLKQRSAAADVEAALCHARGWLSLAYAWLKGGEIQAQDEEGQGTDGESVSATALPVRVV